MAGSGSILSGQPVIRTWPPVRFLHWWSRFAYRSWVMTDVFPWSRFPECTCDLREVTGVIISVIIETFYPLSYVRILAYNARFVQHCKKVMYRQSLHKCTFSLLLISGNARSCRELIDSTRKIRHGRPFAKRVARSLEEPLSVSAEDLIIKSQQYKGYDKCKRTFHGEFTVSRSRSWGRNWITTV